MIFLSGFGNSKDAVAYLKKLVPSQHPFALHALGDIQAYLIYVHEVEIVDAVAARTRVRASRIAAAVLRHCRPALIENNLSIRCHTLIAVITSGISYTLSVPLGPQLNNRKSKARPAFDGRPSNRGRTSSGPRPNGAGSLCEPSLTRIFMRRHRRPFSFLPGPSPSI